MANAVVLKNISKRFSNPDNPQESCLVIDRINLELKEGELLTLVGPRGCGKSTILKMIAGLEHPTEGEIYVDGQIVEGMHPKARNVGLLMPENPLFNHMTVADNILFGIHHMNIPNIDSSRQFERVVTILELEDVLDQRPDQLLQEQQRRLALAMVLAPQPRVLLLDDPFAGLDAEARQQFRSETKVWQRELSISTILATHDRLEALEMGERIAILDRGRFQQIGSLRNLINRPANDFVAEFIGKESMLLGSNYHELNGNIANLESDLADDADDLIDSLTDRQKPEEFNQVELAITIKTFLGRPVRFEVSEDANGMDRYADL